MTEPIKIVIDLTDTKITRVVSGESDVIELHDDYLRLVGKMVQEEEMEASKEEGEEEWKKSLVEKKEFIYDYDIVYVRREISVIQCFYSNARDAYAVQVTSNANCETNLYFLKEEREKALSVHNQLLKWRFG